MDPMLAQASSASSTSTPSLLSNNSALDNWDIGVATLLGVDPQNPGFTIEIFNQNGFPTLRFKTTDTTLFQRFKEIFSSHAQTRHSLRLTVSPQGAAPAPLREVSIQALKQFLEHVAEGKNVLNHFFSPEFLVDTGSIPWTKKDGEQIYFSDFTEKSDLRRAQLEEYKKLLASVTLEELCYALSTATTLNPSTRNKKGVLAPYIDKLLSIRQENDQFIGYFDCRALLQCILPPTLEDQSTEHCFECIVDLQHLLSYLSTIFKEGFFLQSGDDNSAVPIALNPQMSIPQATVITLLLDCSGSMIEVFPMYQQYLKGLLSELKRRTNPHLVTIRIVPFQGSVLRGSITEACLIHLENLERAIDHLSANGSTALNEACTTELHYLTTSPKYLDANKVMVVFTDGKDNSIQEQSKHQAALAALKAQCDNLAGNPYPPQVFMMGLGTEYTFETLELLSNATRAEHVHLRTIDDFNHIFSYIDRFCIQRKLLTFVQGLQTFIVPVYAGRLAISEHALDRRQPFTVNDNLYQSIPTEELLRTQRQLEEQQKRIQEQEARLQQQAEELQKLKEEKEQEELLRQQRQQTRLEEDMAAQLRLDQIQLEPSSGSPALMLSQQGQQAAGTSTLTLAAASPAEAQVVAASAEKKKWCPIL